MEEILKVDHLKASYGRESILKDISFGVKRGEIRMVLGSSGCGKSTLLNNILKFIKSDAGTITYFGKTITIVWIIISIFARYDFFAFFVNIANPSISYNLRLISFERKNFIIYTFC